MACNAATDRSSGNYQQHDTDVAHCNFKAYKPILVIFGRYVAESTLSNGM